MKINDSSGPSDFIRTMIAEDVKAGKHGGGVVTRFPPEPNGYMHIGHAKAFTVNFSIAEEFGGRCHLRFDDTDPAKENVEYVESIKEDIRWMGFDWGEHLYFASDYFERMYDYAVQLIEASRAYVCDLTAERIREYRGTLRTPGRDSPCRSRSVEENLDLFGRMRAGEFPDGARVLRAKIDMAHPNMNMRDPVMYRIMHASHFRQGSKWCIYPMYDWAHGIEDSIEGVTHSLCSLEFENHRPLYDWFLDALGVHHPRQIEFARLNLTYTVMSKRRLLELVEGGHVSGWDDPRMPTISGLRRRGYTPESIRDFLRRVGVNKFNSTIDIALLEHCLRKDLNKIAPRVMGVLRPMRVVIDNYPEGQVEQLDAINNPENPADGTRKVPFSKVIYIEREDFMEDPPRKFFRLSPGREVRLRYAYFITCTDVIKDENGRIIELHCTYDPATRGGDSPDGRKVKATLHWVSAEHSLQAEVRLYDHLLTGDCLKQSEAKTRPLAETSRVQETCTPYRTGSSEAKTRPLADASDWKANLNPDSLEVLAGCRVEPSLADSATAPNRRYQFERQGYFCVDPDSTEDKLVFNRTVSLRDTWARLQKQQQKK